MARTPDRTLTPRRVTPAHGAAESRKTRGDLTAIAFRIAAHLEAYQLQIERLAADWSNRRLYRALSARLHDISGLLGAIPQLAVDLVEVVVWHVKLLQLLQDQGTGKDLSQLQARQTDAILCLRRKTLRLITGSAGAH